MGVVAVIWSPVRTLRWVAEGRSALPGLLVVAACAALGLIVSTTLVLAGVTRGQMEQAIEQQGQPGLPPGLFDGIVRATEVAAPIISVLSPFATWIFVSLLMQLVTRFFNGSGPLRAMLGVVGVAQVTFLVSGILSVFLVLLQSLVGIGEPAGVAIGYLSSLVSLAFLVWYAVLVVIGAAQARNIGYGESAGSCAISCVGLAILIILVGVILGIGAAIVLSAAVPQ